MMISWAVPSAKEGYFCHLTRQAAACSNFMQIFGTLLLVRCMQCYLTQTQIFL